MLSSLITISIIMAAILVIFSRLAPTPVARSIPSGGAYKVPDGYRTTITLTQEPGIWFWEVEVKPMVLDGGEPIETTTMLNAAWRTMAPQSLKKLDVLTIKVAYDPDVTNNLIQTAINNRFDTVTITYPTNDTLAFYGYVQKWDADPMVVGKMPTATITIVPTNFDAANQVEAGPVYHSAGT
jgi:hypothetical protein